MNLLSLAPLLALIFCSISIALLLKPAQSCGLADLPGGRKQHHGAIPLVGGLGVFIGFLVVQPLLAVPIDELLPLYVGIVLLVVCGVIDDARDMDSTVKLAVQLTSALLMVVWGHRVLNYLGDFPVLGPVFLGWLAIPVTVVAVTGLINAVNMMDGVDGLAGGSVLSVLVWLGFVAGLQGQIALFAIIVTLAASVVGFLLFNLRHPWRKRASVFLGDAGSMALGFAVAWFVVELSQSSKALISPIAYGWLIALPVMDTLSLMVRRIRKGQSPFSADRDHLHHIFLRAGFSAGQTTMVLILLVAVMGGIGIMASLAGVPDVLLLAGLLVFFWIHDVFVRRAWLTSKALRRLNRNALNIPYMHYSGQMLRMRRDSRREGWICRLALAGLYLMMFGVGADTRLMLLGGAISAAAAMLAYPSFWQDTLRTKFFWTSLILTLYVLIRGTAAGMLSGGDESSIWWALLAVGGLAALPLAWWIAQFRLHWTWLVLALAAGGGIGFVIQADWRQLTFGDLTDPWAWGAPSHVGFIASLGVVMVSAMLLAGLRRFGSGWRPMIQVAMAILIGVPGIIVLMGSNYLTAWLATMIGMLVYVAAVPVLGRHRGNYLGRHGILGLLAVPLLALIIHDWLLQSDGTLGQRVLAPLQSIGLLLSDDSAQVEILHPGIAERLQLWALAWRDFEQDWLWGNGRISHVLQSQSLAGYRDYSSLFLVIGSGLGLVGLIGYAAVVLLPLRALLRVSFTYGLGAIWGVGILSGGVTVVVFCLLSTPLYQPSAVGLIVLLTAAAQVAVFQNQWLAHKIKPEQAQAAGP